MIFLRVMESVPATPREFIRPMAIRVSRRSRAILSIGAGDPWNWIKTADAIAQNLGIPIDSPERIDAGIEHTLWS